MKFINLMSLQVAQALFIVFNSFQGLFIFLLYCVRKPTIRKQWGLTCCEGKHRKRDASSESRGSGNTGSSSVITGMRPAPWEKCEGSSKTDFESASYMFNPAFDEDVVDEEGENTTLGVTEATVEG